MMIELLRPLGPELGRRWLAALLLVDEADRPGVVESIEKHIVSVYGPAAARSDAGGVEVKLVHPPVQREGFVERVEVTYARQDPPAQRKSGRSRGA